MEIKQGSFLLQVPKNAGGATIRTSTVTAAITGTIAGQMDGKRNGSLQPGYVLGSGDSVRINDDADNPNNLINGSHSGFDPEFPNGNPNNNPPVTGPGNNSPITGPNGPWNP